jgi:hypothetical protein
MEADDVAARVAAILEATREEHAPDFDDVPIEVLSVEAMTLREALAAIDAELPGGEEADPIAWLVHANGPFVSERGRGDARLVGTTGYYVLDDGTGDTVGVSFSP